MGGKVEKVNKTVKEMVSDREENTKSYYQRVGLGSIETSQDADRYFHMSPAEMRKLSRHECGEAAYMLIQESLYVQQQINKSRAKIDWANTYIDKLVGDSLSQVDRYVPKEFKRVLAIKNNDKAEELQKVVEKDTYRMNLLNFLPT